MLLLKLSLIVFLIIWLVAMVMAYSYGRVGRRIQKLERLSTVDASLPPLSVIITAHNQASALRRHLPAILEQDYERFEVIVVNTGSNDETKDVLERLELRYANLRHTFTPRSARDISLERLALTLGIRSAIHEWVVLTHPDCEPASSQWLTRIGETIANPRRGVQSKHLKEPDIIIGFARYNRHRTSWFDRKVDFHRLWNNIVGFNHILSGHAAMRADGCNLAYRKSLFIENGGMAAHQELTSGAEELLVNHNAKPHNTALMLSPSALMLQDPLPARRLWKQQRVFYCETRRHQRHRHLYRATQALRLFMPWLLLVIAIVVPALYPIMQYLETMQVPLLDTLDLQPTDLISVSAIVLILLLIYVILKIVSFNRTASQLGCRRYYLSLIIFELALPFWNLSAAIAHRRASKNEFRKKFV